MAEISRKSLFGKLNATTYKCVEAATVFCKMRGNPYVELVHWIHQFLQLTDTDLHRIVKQYNINPSNLARDITESLDKLPRGASSISDLSDHVEDAVERGWVYGSLMFNEPAIRSGHVIIGCLKTRSLKNVLMGISAEFDKVDVDDLCAKYEKLLGDSPEARSGAADGSQLGAARGEPGEASGAIAPAQMGREDAIKQFCVDLTERARNGEIDPIVGRDAEVRQIVDILMRRRQNNPILTGEAGVGKTAVVEGFAHRIVDGDVPPPMQNVRLLSLDVGGLQAGASMKGEFENRLKQVIEEVQASETPIVMFIDEVHTLIGAGGSAGTGDAAQLLKPALARGTLRTIAATTWDEYKKHIEKDPALTRRFQTIDIDEPSEERAILMMRKIAGFMENHHKVQILDEAVEAAVKLSSRFIQGRQLPDKSVSLIDTACARVAIGQHAVPAEVDDSRKRIQAMETELDILAREKNVGVQHDDRIANVEAALGEERERLESLEADWQAEKELVEQILEIRATLRGPSGAEPVEGTGSESEAAADDAAAEESIVQAAGPQLSEDERQKLLADLTELHDQLEALQGERPLILPACDAKAVASVVADWTGIPVGSMVKDEIQQTLELGAHLGKRVVGQQHGLDAIAEVIQISRANLENPNKPIGVFMLAGTSGVGKTETALALAEAFYGGEQSLITINMSEFQESHTVSTLKGAPPGYVGYGEGGILTEAVRRNPYSIVLLDEMEKAHSDVHEIFFQVFDKGMMEDGEGRLINFKNTIIILTTNVGSDLIMNMCKDPEFMPGVEGLQKALREPLLKAFPAALLGRLAVIPYYPLSETMIEMISDLQLKKIQKRIALNHNAEFNWTPEVIDLIKRRCDNPESGGRLIESILTQNVLPSLSRQFLNVMLEGNEIKAVDLGVDNDKFTYAFS